MRIFINFHSEEKTANADCLVYNKRVFSVFCFSSVYRFILFCLFVQPLHSCSHSLGASILAAILYLHSCVNGTNLSFHLSLRCVYSVPESHQSISLISLFTLLHLPPKLSSSAALSVGPYWANPDIGNKTLV